MNKKLSKIIIKGNGSLYVSADVRQSLGRTFSWKLIDGAISLRSATGVMFYDNGVCCDSRLPKSLGIKGDEKLEILLVECGDGSWSGIYEGRPMRRSQLITQLRSALYQLECPPNGDPVEFDIAETTFEFTEEDLKGMV